MSARQKVFYSLLTRTKSSKTQHLSPPSQKPKGRQSYSKLGKVQLNFRLDLTVRCWDTAA